MGLVLDPAEIKINMEILRSYLERVIVRYQNVLERVHEYNSNEDLDTKSFRKSKHKMDICYRLIAEGMIAVQESMAGDIDTLLSSIGDEYLDEDELIAQIERLKMQCAQYEEKIRSLQSMKPILGLVGSSRARGLIERYRKNIENLKEQIAVLQEKINFLHETEALTANLFESAMSLLTAVHNAITDGGVNLRTENGFAGGLTWLTELGGAEVEEIDEVGETEEVDDVDGKIDGDMEGVLVLPQPGDTITVSRGVDSNGKHIYVDAVVSQWNAWSIEYSISKCNSEYSDGLCCERLNYAVKNYECNKNDDDLLMFNLEGYDAPVFAGAMVDGYADIGDIVKVTLDDGTDFNFLILDVKDTGHTIEELAEDNQCQCEWGHGYILGEQKVQLSVCEFITAGGYSVNSAIYADSGKFLLKRSVVRAQIVDSIPICD